MEDKTLNALRWIAEILRHHGVPYQISGGFAARLYGSTRELNDIDIDIPERHFATIHSDIAPFVIFGPERFRDGKWDCELITLSYHGQEIDICGAETTQISTKDRARMIPIPADLSKARSMTFEGTEVPVIDPHDLIAYKSELDGEHQQTDIDAVQQYLSEQKTA